MTLLRTQLRRALPVLLGCALTVSPAAAGIGDQLFSAGGSFDIEVLPASAGFKSELWLYSPGPPLFIANNSTDVGKVVTLAGFPKCSELIFEIRVNNTSTTPPTIDTFKLGPGARNPDGIPHATLTKVAIGPGAFDVGFEDTLGGGDMDYNDVVFRFTGGVRTAPPVAESGGPYSAACNGSPTKLTLDGTGSLDPNGNPLTYAWSSDCPDYTFDDPTVATPLLSLDGKPSCSLKCTVTLVVADICGQTGTVSTTVTIQDSTEPAFVDPPVNQTIACDDPIPAADLAATDDCSSKVDVAPFERRFDGVCVDTFTLARSWIATDECGNFATHAQKISVQDIVGPAITGVPPNQTAECNAVPVPATPAATDNCDPMATLAFAETRIDGACEDNFVLQREWTASDRCGNTSSARQKVTVQDTTEPVIMAILMPTTPLPPASAASPRSACSPPTSRQFQVVCDAVDDCDPTPGLNAKLLVSQFDVSRRGTCALRVDEVVVSCGEVLELRMLPPACANKPRSPQPSVSANSAGIRVVSGERITLEVTSQDRCGNEAMASFDPAAPPSARCDELLDDGTCCPAIGRPPETCRPTCGVP